MKDHNIPLGAPSIFNDPPVVGAIQWLLLCHRAGKTIIINSTRLNDETENRDVQNAMKTYLRQHGCPQEVVEALHFWTGKGKPRARVYIDDRAVQFEGVFPHVKWIEGFDVWNRWQRIRNKR